MRIYELRVTWVVEMVDDGGCYILYERAGTSARGCLCFNISILQSTNAIRVWNIVTQREKKARHI